jgi:hypothetical protein
MYARVVRATSTRAERPDRRYAQKSWPVDGGALRITDDRQPPTDDR